MLHLRLGICQIQISLVEVRLKVLASQLRKHKRRQLCLQITLVKTLTRSPKNFPSKLSLLLLMLFRSMTEEDHLQCIRMDKITPWVPCLTSRSTNSVQTNPLIPAPIPPSTKTKSLHTQFKQNSLKRRSKQERRGQSRQSRELSRLRMKDRVSRFFRCIQTT